MNRHEILALHGGSTSVLIELAVGAVPVWRHFGAKLSRVPAMEQWGVIDGKLVAPSRLDRRDGVALFPGEANGPRQAPALSMHRDGRDWVHECVLSAWDASVAGQLRLTLSDTVARIAVDMLLILEADSDVLRVTSTLHNEAAAPLTVNWLAAASIAMPASVREIGYFTGQWGHEFQWQRQPLTASGWEQINRVGRTSHAGPATCFLLTPETRQFSGEAWAAHLAWSGNHRSAVLPNDDASFCLQAGEWLAPGEMTLAPGATISTPELLVAHSSCGIDAASGALHEHLRRHVLQWPDGHMRARPVHLNTWEAVYFRHEPAEILALADAAAGIGIERFVLDDGWFAGRESDAAALGDWWPDAKKYPQGLSPLIGYVNGLGMEFGIWVEPEMVSPDSQLFRAHPDWALQIEGRPRLTGRNQLVLDISRPEVFDYLYEKLDTLLREHAIAYLKWDMNRDLAQAGDVDGRAAYHRQVPALYQLLSALRTAHPAVEIESCSSGGARADYGILRHTQRLWISDNNDALSRLRIQSGAFRLFPLEISGSHVGPAPAHTTGRSQSLGFRGAISLFGHFGVEADIRQFSTSECEELADWIGLYKALRSTLHQGRFHQGESSTGLVWWMAMGQARAVLGIFRATPPNAANEPPLLLPPCAGDSDWRVRLERCVGTIRAHGSNAAPLFDAYRQSGVLFAGDELALSGLPLPTMNPESALIFVLERSVAGR